MQCLLLGPFTLIVQSERFKTFLYVIYSKSNMYNFFDNCCIFYLQLPLKDHPKVSKFAKFDSDWFKR